ncbi:MAG: phosphohydrolase [SAR86 cluster bacterium]|uniref:Phosphohydrolase n=1 Tax=SAR86 cluster bacterium TaxID=2030880 RepID=A0A2A4MK63_9GAMM|nr:MAG: phosphohydrolase [SAR86 cluster bacterium]
MQVTLVTGLFAVFFYLLGCVLQGMKLSTDEPTHNLTPAKGLRNRVFTLGLLAVFAHMISAYGVIKTSSGYHFGIVEISTLISVSISLIALISSIRKPLENLFLGLFPLAIVAIIASLTLSSNYPPTDMSPGLASHILFSILAYSILTIAALQAMFVAYQNKQLKNHRSNSLIKRLPPLQDMEVFLFELLWAGQILLSLGILAGVLFIDNFWGLEGIPHKTLFSILAWIVFSILLWGRHQMGWRGQTAIRGTLTGFTFLILGFYGSKIALEFIFN